MSNIVRFAVSLDEALLRRFDEVCTRQNYVSRSEAIRDIIRDHLVDERWDEKHEAMGTITLVYDHNVRALSDKLTATQHEHHDLVISAMHVHLDHENCLEVLVVKGRGLTIRALADRLISMKGVKHGKLTVTTTGRELA